MGARAAQAEIDAVAREDESDVPVKGLVRKLIAEAQRQVVTSAGNGGVSPADVLIDLEVDGMRCVISRAQKPASGPTVLSRRELEIARMIARGYPNKSIAAALDISSWTVCTHLRRSFSKLGVTSRAAMIARMAESGLLDAHNHGAAV
jgi:DNA-binding CsgD family transcriptional regulator